MADIPEAEILELIRSRVEAPAVERLFEAALQSAGIARKPFYSPGEVITLGTAITEASFNLLEEALGQMAKQSPLAQGEA